MDCINWDISDFNLGMWYRCMVPMIRKFLESSGYYFHILFPITAYRGFVEKAVIERVRRPRAFSHLNPSTHSIFFVTFYYNITEV